MRRTLTLILGVALFGILAAVVVASQGADDPAGSETVTETVERTTTTEDNPNRIGRDDNGAQTGVDISGPCDEAEHANDPRCNGAATGGRDDNSGPGSHSGRDDDRGDDRSDDRGGHSGGDDDSSDDSGGESGHGGGGHGGGDDD